MGDNTSSEVLTDHQQELYLRLQSYCFDAPGGAVSFAAKLACEQGWSAAKSERVLGEYRRFLLLALEAGHPVSPSRAVDLAWHQHLLDTRSYWQEFCPRVLGRPVGFLIIALIFVTLTLIATMFTSFWLDPKDLPDPRGGQTDGDGGASSGGCGGGGCGGGGGGGGGCGG
jgi:hypothetical protein